MGKSQGAAKRRKYTDERNRKLPQNLVDIAFPTIDRGWKLKSTPLNTAIAASAREKTKTRRHERQCPGRAMALFTLRRLITIKHHLYQLDFVFMLKGWLIQSWLVYPGFRLGNWRIIVELITVTATDTFPVFVVAIHQHDDFIHQTAARANSPRDKSLFHNHPNRVHRPRHDQAAALP